MTKHAWVKELPIIITVSDAEGDIIEMNDSSIKYFENDGGDLLIGSDLLACHPEPYLTKLKTMIETQTANIYSFEEDGKKKLVYQMPWHQDGKYAGFIEMIMEIPDEIPHHAD
jgi:hypothetical protein